MTVPLGIIDVHTHYVPRGWPDLSTAVAPADDWPWLRIESERDAVIMVRDTEFRRVDHRCWDADVRLAGMDADGVATQVVSPTPVFFSYARSAADGLGICTVFNDLALDVCAPGDGRLVPFAQVPLQDPDAACRELDRCLDNGHRGVEIGNHVGDDDLDADGVVTFLQHCAARGAPVLVHPWDMAGGPRTDRWMAQWLTGMPAETHLSILAMVLGGVFDRVPDSLRICFAHGGGSFAFWLGRVENAWHRRNDVVGTSEHPPSHYVGRFSVDSVVFAEPALRLLVDTLGVGQVMTGSDFPYPLGEQPVGDVVRRAGFLDDAARAAILRGNAERWLGLDPAAAGQPVNAGDIAGRQIIPS